MEARAQEVSPAETTWVSCKVRCLGLVSYAKILMGNWGGSERGQTEKKAESWRTVSSVLTRLQIRSIAPGGKAALPLGLLVMVEPGKQRAWNV